MIEFPDEEERRRKLEELIGIEDKVWVRVDAHERAWAIADEDLDRDTDSKTSSVHFLRFEVTQSMAEALSGALRSPSESTIRATRRRRTHLPRCATLFKRSGVTPARGARALALLALAAGCAQPRTFTDELDTKPWEAQKALLPPYPKAASMVPFYVGPGPFAFFVDSGSVRVGQDGVVRYTLIARSRSGATNVSYEGIRCEGYARRVYAFGSDASWSRRPIRMGANQPPSGGAADGARQRFLLSRARAGAHDRGGAAHPGAGEPALIAGSQHHEVVAMDQLRLVDIAEDRLDLARSAPGYPAGLLRVVVDQPARDFGALGR